MRSAIERQLCLSYSVASDAVTMYYLKAGDQLL